MDSPKALETQAPRKKTSLKKVLVVVVGVLVVIALASVAVKNNSKDSQSGSLMLNVSTNSTGIVVTNLEDSDWQGCMVGVNGSTGWGFDNPPYQTRAPVSIPTGKTITVTYQQMTTEDGTMFDPSTHAVNTIVVDCFRGTNAERSWVGTLK